MSTQTAITLPAKVVTREWGPIRFRRVPSTVTTVVIGAHECELLTSEGAMSIAFEVADRDGRIILVGARGSVAQRMEAAAERLGVSVVVRDDIPATALLRS